ncbi:MAG: hypothetical protein SF053_05870 [Bacteroidia bacterium]|nr:hypothetical protein [Bacteroidia bacterium]
MCLYRSLGLSVCILLLLPMKAQRLDSVVYTTDFERKVFALLVSGSVPGADSLVFAISDPSGKNNPVQAAADARLRMERIYTVLDAAKISAKPLPKKVKMIFDLVHKELLRYYDEDAIYAQLFERGIYNCLTATLLYAQIFDHYGIVYDIKELPSHVYLVVSPGVENILVETTLPVTGFQAPGEAFQRQYVETIILMGRMTREHAIQVGFASAFNESYYDKDNINLRTAAAFQYYNYALRCIEQKQFVEALAAIRKARLMAGASSPRLDVVYAQAIANLQLLNKARTAQGFYYLAELANIISSPKVEMELINTIQALGEQFLMRENNPLSWNLMHETLQAYLISDSLRHILKSMYHNGNGIWHYSKGAYWEALDEAEISMRLTPNNLYCFYLIKETLLAIVRWSQSEPEYGTKLLLRMEQYQTTLPVLMTFPEVVNLYHWLLIDQLQTYIGTGALAEADSLFTRIEGMYASSDILAKSINSSVYQWIGEAYYREKNKTKALYWLEKGLERYPKDAQLLDWQRLVKLY